MRNGTGAKEELSIYATYSFNKRILKPELIEKQTWKRLEEETGKRIKQMLRGVII